MQKGYISYPLADPPKGEAMKARPPGFELEELKMYMLEFLADVNAEYNQSLETDGRKDGHRSA